jgi:hypothetical protein
MESDANQGVVLTAEEAWISSIDMSNMNPNTKAWFEQAKRHIHLLASIDHSLSMWCAWMDQFATFCDHFGTLMYAHSV